MTDRFDTVLTAHDHRVGVRRLTADEARAVLYTTVTESQWYRIGTAHGERVRIMFEGRWYDLARTDLRDDCATWIRTGQNLDYDQNPPAYMARRCYGARVKEHDDGRRSFQVIDTESDG